MSWGSTEGSAQEASLAVSRLRDDGSVEELLQQPLFVASVQAAVLPWSEALGPSWAGALQHDRLPTRTDANTWTAVGGAGAPRACRECSPRGTP